MRHLGGNTRVPPDTSDAAGLRCHCPAHPRLLTTRVTTSLAQTPHTSRAKDEKAVLHEGVTPAGWSTARARQIDRDGRWTIKRGRKARPPESAPRQAATQIAVPVFG